jgi:hypothetical protein
MRARRPAPVTIAPPAPALEPIELPEAPSCQYCGDPRCPGDCPAYYESIVDENEGLDERE